MMQIDESKRTGQQPRPYLLRRGTGAPGGGSFKRRSLKLRRGTKEGRDMDMDCEHQKNIYLNNLLLINLNKFQGKYLTLSKEQILFNRKEKLVHYLTEVTLRSLEQPKEVKKNLREF